ncbi:MULTISPECIES: hypothetical protein [Nonomuraea]|uniref:hypothetical protein n=1 Tax=Nonomuraea TaxID=83681 RepID=UPI001CDA3F6D|nr:hypothetical protein [Nonomuraea gerenzanensis]UBU16639.1 hypothetical protein LCN96_16960 [Nonomuraea gerenzanensis]
MSNTATEVISDALTSTSPSADDILDALGNAGYHVIRPEDGPAWIPVTPRSLAKAQRIAALINDGKTLQQIAAETRMSLRQVERYSAAAREMELIERRR